MAAAVTIPYMSKSH